MPVLGSGHGGRDGFDVSSQPGMSLFLIVLSGSASLEPGGLESIVEYGHDHGKPVGPDGGRPGHTGRSERLSALDSWAQRPFRGSPGRAEVVAWRRDALARNLLKGPGNKGEAMMKLNFRTPILTACTPLVLATALTGCMVMASGDDGGHEGLVGARTAAVTVQPPAQTIATVGAEDAEAFTIAGEHYLAIANSWNGTAGSAVASEVLKYDSALGEFVHSQYIATDWASDFEHFTMNGEHYLAVANQRTTVPWNNNVDSRVYKWNGAGFDPFQDIPTSGAGDFEHALIDGDHYLIVANSTDNTSFDIDSQVLRYDAASTAFVHHQYLATRHARDCETFTIDGTQYLAIANTKGGDSQSSTKVVDSTIHAWDDTINQYVEIQAIPTEGALDWAHFAIDDEHYLAVANSGNDSSGNVDSVVYQWNGSAFAEIQRIATAHASDLEVVQNGMLTHLAVGHYFKSGTRNTDSFLYRWNGTAFADPEAIPTHGVFAFEHFEIGGYHYLAVANQHDDQSYALDSAVAGVDYVPGIPVESNWASVDITLRARAQGVDSGFQVIDYTQDPPADVDEQIAVSSHDPAIGSSAQAESDLVVDLDYMVPGDFTSGRLDLARSASIDSTIDSSNGVTNSNRYMLSLRPQEDCTLHLRLSADMTHISSLSSILHPKAIFGIEYLAEIVLTGPTTVNETAYLDIPLTAGTHYTLAFQSGGSYSHTRCYEELDCSVDMTDSVTATWYID